MVQKKKDKKLNPHWIADHASFVLYGWDKQHSIIGQPINSLQRALCMLTAPTNTPKKGHRERVRVYSPLSPPPAQITPTCPPSPSPLK